MNEERIVRDTVSIDDSVHDIYKRLTGGNDPVDVPFQTMKDVFMWAASLGYQRGERKPIRGKRTTIFRWAQFSSQTDIPLIKAMAIADSGDVDVLMRQEDVLTAVEEYANAGIISMESRLLNANGQNLWNLVGLLA